LIGDERVLPSSGGQLVLFYGEPGVGKTYAIRSLSSAWSDWCGFEYVMDPEEFLGNSSYMMEVLTHGENHVDEHMDHEAPKWRVLVLEDAGELLTADAKERTGQGLSRMLNITDGLIGQGLQILILITTNEPIRQANPSVVRPGRCAIEIHFERFDKVEGDEWLRDKDADTTSISPRSVTLAELYNLLDDRRIIAR
jgi:ATP-dependent 26S proteasome regulatory subunit